MANTGVTVEVPPPPPMPGRGGLLDSLRVLGLLREYTDDVPSGATDRQVRGLDALPGGLWAATRDNIGWMARSQSRPIGCGDTQPWVECSDTDDYDAKATGAQPDVNTQNAWEVVADDACSMFSVTYEERVERAVENLRRKQGNAVADEMWHGTIATAETWESLTLTGSASALTVPGEASPLSYALGALQEALAECLGDGQAGIIHATRTTATKWYQDGALDFDLTAGLLRDMYGNVIVTSGGYDGADPDGLVDASTPWAYATGPVVVRLGPILVRPGPDDWGDSMNRTTNDLTVWAERSVSYQFDGCCVYGIGVDICNTCCGTTGS